MMLKYCKYTPQCGARCSATESTNGLPVRVWAMKSARTRADMDQISLKNSMPVMALTTGIATAAPATAAPATPAATETGLAPVALTATWCTFHSCIKPNTPIGLKEWSNSR